MQNKINEKIELGSKIKVWIGDPCYVIPDEIWDNVCDQIFAETEREVNQVIKFELCDLRVAGVSDEMLDNYACKKLEFIQCGTAYGDGIYRSQSLFKYGVDSGCLAAVPEYLIDPRKMHEADRLGKFFEAIDFIGLKTDGTGMLEFYDAKGVLEIIDTGDEEDENAEE